jgi:amino acid transporter
MANRSQRGLNNNKARFNAFSGVFVPTTLTILGLILFLRLGWVVGHTGLVAALVIIAIAVLIAFITGLCLSSIASNMLVKTGGLYYMISRTLGIEIGGAIGIPLYLSQAVSVAFYIIGFSEAFTATFPSIDPKLVSTALVLLFGSLTFMGADFALRIQYLILAALLLAVGSFFLGGWGSWSEPSLLPAQGSEVSFWTAFAVFFPAVTGIAVGVSMSGDLKNPAKDIPLGTMSSIGFTAFIYVAAAVWLAGHASPQDLISNKLIMYDIAAWPGMILVGIWASTLSSALGSMVAAPRTLQAIASDEALPSVLKSQMGSPTEPRAATLVTIGIALLFVWMGNLNYVAPIITMFFLNTYGMINLTSGLEAIIGNPSFRPTFRTPWPLALLGAAGCYITMFLINAPATGAAILATLAIFVLLQRRSLEQNWGDVQWGAWFTLARFSIFRLEEERWRPRNWRPNIIVFTALREGIDPLLNIGSWFSAGRGIVAFHNLLIGDYAELAEKGMRDAARKQLRKYVTQREGSILSGSSVTKDYEEGVLSTLQVYGVAGIEPNAALFGWGLNKESRIAQIKMAAKILAFNKSTIFLKYDEKRKFGQKRTIDIWWRGQDKNADLMLLLAHITSMSQGWPNAQIRLLRLIHSEQGRQGAHEHLSQLLSSVRVHAKPEIVVRNQESAFADVLAQVSSQADLVFMGMAKPDPDRAEEQVERTDHALLRVGSTILVRSGEQEEVL